MKSCSTCNPPDSHQARPIRNAYVPVPPASPVVSVSRKSHCDGSERRSLSEGGTLGVRGLTGSNRRSASGFRPQGSGEENHCCTTRCSPKRFFPTAAPSRRAKASDSSTGRAAKSSSAAGRRFAGRSAATRDTRSSKVRISSRAAFPESPAPHLWRARRVLRRGPRTMGSPSRTDMQQSARESSAPANRERERAARRSRFLRGKRRKDKGSVRKILFPVAPNAPRKSLRRRILHLHRLPREKGGAGRRQCSVRGGASSGAASLVLRTPAAGQTCGSAVRKLEREAI